MAKFNTELKIQVVGPLVAHEKAQLALDYLMKVGPLGQHTSLNEAAEKVLKNYFRGDVVEKP